VSLQDSAKYDLGAGWPFIDEVALKQCCARDFGDDLAGRQFAVRALTRVDFLRFGESDQAS